MDNNQQKKITANDAIAKILSYVNIGNMDAAYDIAFAYLETIASGGDNWWKIKRVLDARPLKMIMLKDLAANVKNLIIQNGEKEGVMYLDSETQFMVDELVKEWNNRGVLKCHNIPVRNKILLHGATGNGKTTIAKHVSEISGLPFVEIKSDEVIESHLGSTSANVYKILNGIKEPCVLFWDEVDSIGHKRGHGTGSSAQLENDRMTNSLLTNLDKISNDIIFIGATNRLDILDSAFLRRFDIKYEVKPPTIESKKDFICKLLEYYKMPELNIVDFEGLDSYSDIKKEVIKIARERLLAMV